MGATAQRCHCRSMADKLTNFAMLLRFVYFSSWHNHSAARWGETNNKTCAITPWRVS